MINLPNPFVTDPVIEPDDPPVEENRFHLDEDRFMVDITRMEPPAQVAAVQDSAWLYQLWEVAAQLPEEKPLFLAEPKRRYA